MSGEALIQQTRRVGVLTLTAASIAGAVVVFMFLAAVLPAPSGTPAGRALALNLPIFVAYIAIGAVFAIRWGDAIANRRLAWLREERQPDPDEQRLSLRLP